MKINYFKLYISMVLLLIVIIFGYREYRLTIGQDADITIRALSLCADHNTNTKECTDGAKEFLILNKK